MKSKIQQWEEALNRLTTQFKNHFGALSAIELNRKPNPDTWSIAENIDHLIKINESYYPVLKEASLGTQKLPFLAKFSFFPNLLGNLLLKSVSPDRKKKIKTFNMWEPDNSNLGGDILQRFEKHQQELIAMIRSSEDLLNKETVISSPANKMIVYKLETAFDILVTHEERHLIQALEVLKQE